MRRMQRTYQEDKGGSISMFGMQQGIMRKTQLLPRGRK